MNPPRLIAADDRALVPLYPRLGVDRDEVVDDLVQQIEKVASCLGESETTL
jgi:hypothetical protein